MHTTTQSKLLLPSCAVIRELFSTFLRAALSPIQAIGAAGAEAGREACDSQTRNFLMSKKRKKEAVLPSPPPHLLFFRVLKTLYKKSGNHVK